MSDPGANASEFDQGLFQHDAGAQYLHLFREVLLSLQGVRAPDGGEDRRLRRAVRAAAALALADGRSTTSELARELDVDPAAVTRLVAGLHELGLVEREDDARDRRRRPVVLTASGRDFMVKLHAELHARETSLGTQLDPADVATAAEVLRTIRSVLEPGARGRRV